MKCEKRAGARSLRTSRGDRGELQDAGVTEPMGPQRKIFGGKLGEQKTREKAGKRTEGGNGAA